jgi:hypothetical protein
MKGRAVLVHINQLVGLAWHDPLLMASPLRPATPTAI